MEFDWDERKRLKVLEERGVDLLYAAGIFEGAIVRDCLRSPRLRAGEGFSSPTRRQTQSMPVVDAGGIGEAWQRSGRRKAPSDRTGGLFRQSLTRIDDRNDYGEVRRVSIGLVEGECFVVVHTERKGVVRLITAWKGGRDERSEYQASISRRH